MTHKQTWTEIAEAFLTPENEGTIRQRRLAHSGLCFAQGGYENENNNIGRFIRRLRPRDIFWFPIRRGMLFRRHWREYDLIRGDFATLIACMTKKEFDLLVAVPPPNKRIYKYGVSER